MGSLLRDVVGTLGAWFIYALIALFGRRVEDEDAPWLAGPLGGPVIGDRPYEETARREGLLLRRNAERGGLIHDFAGLASPTFRPDAVAEPIRAFYENTAGYSLDTWASTYFPTNLALWLLVTAISRRVDQLDFPLDGLDVAYGMTSEIILLERPDGSVRYTGWFRRLAKTGRVIYTGFYMTETIPGHEGPVVKVVFPMPNGNATVLLRPENGPDGGLRLVSAGDAFGDAGFYRRQRLFGGTRVWRIRSLRERFELTVDERGDVRCEHGIRFLSLPVLTLHYRIVPRRS